VTRPPRVLPLLATTLVAALIGGAAPVAQTYDLAIVNGRVMDPESGLDAVRTVAVSSGRIAAIVDGPVDALEVVDASGLVVAPGFVDLHAHGQDLFSATLQAQDGVTTALELEGGALPVAGWYAERDGRALINFGASVSHGAARRNAIGPERDTRYEAATADEIGGMRRRLGEALDEGAIGIGYGLAYAPGAAREEIFRMFELSRARGVVNFVHVRGAGLQESTGSVDAVQEMIAAAAASGASVHIVHIGSSGLRSIDAVLDMIGGAQFRGLDVTTEVYPYTAASTDIRAAIFDPGWREALGADFDDIEWVATGDRLNAESFAIRREEGGMIIAHIIPETTVETALANPLVMVASDGVGFVNGRAHPRGAGTFARVLGRYVRERGTLTLMDALRKMTLMPARRLEGWVPQMRLKGRVRVGADADLTLFDPVIVLDRATFAEPAQPSVGIPHVLVGGTFVVRDGTVVTDAFPGRAIRRDIR
jgi:N-acyl-D-aspartate/D-glutamate deacylase